MTPLSVRVRCRAAAAVAGLVLCWGNTAAAATTHAAWSNVDVVIISILNLTDGGGGTGDLIIEGSAGVDDTDEFSIGQAASTFSGATAVNGEPLALGVGDGFSLVSEISGQAAAGGSTEALHLASGEIFIDNRSATHTFRVTLGMDYAAGATTTVDDVVAEYAYAEAYVEATEGLNALIYEELVADTDFDLGGNMLQAMHAPSFTFDLAPGESRDILVFADVLGGASSFVVPLPGALVLLGSGLLVLGRRRTRPMG